MAQVLRHKKYPLKQMPTFVFPAIICFTAANKNITRIERTPIGEKNSSKTDQTNDATAKIKGGGKRKPGL